MLPKAAVGDLKLRVFKTAWFTKAARKALIADEELCAALEQVLKGQCDDLGGGVFKKRLDKNRHRSIIIAKSERCWVYEYMYAKKDRNSIDKGELADFRLLAKGYAGLSIAQITRLVAEKDLLEICNGRQG